MKRIFITLLVFVSILQHAFAEKTNLECKNSITFSSNFQYSEVPAITYSRNLWKNNWLKVGFNYFGNYEYDKGFRYEDGELISYSYERSETNNMSQFSLGVEKREMINEKLELDFGGAFLIIPSLRTNFYDDPNKPEQLRKWSSFAYRLGFDLNVGLFYVISNHFQIGSRFTPYVTFKKNKIYEKYNLEWNLTNHSFLSLRYRF